MEIVINIDNKNNIIELDKNLIFFGRNSNYKNKVFNTLTDGLLGKNKNILVDGKSFNAKDYNIININEENDFTNEFKFTKNNALKQIIYNDVINKINEEKILKYTNKIFDIIDDKVNCLLDRKINKKSDNNISFQIEIPDVNSVIDKFTNIYIDDVLLSDSEISKSMKRKLLYQLYFLDIKNLSDKPTIVIINNFDVYLNSTEIINLLNIINNLSKNNCHFILSSCNNIFEYLDIENYNIYKVTDKIINFNIIEEGIKVYLLRNEFDKNNDMSFDNFYLENESLISNDEILNIKTKIINKYPTLISKILNSDSIKVALNKPKNVTCEYIICDCKESQTLFLEISNKFID
ncbi:MAG: hypothetical protein ACI310_06670 [Bacilli bacterium]